MSRTCPRAPPSHFRSDRMCRNHTGSRTGANVFRSDRSRRDRHPSLVHGSAWWIGRMDAERHVEIDDLIETTRDRMADHCSER